MAKLLRLTAAISLAGATSSACTDPRCIRIGAMVPVTGKQQTPGYYYQSGYEMAVAHANSKGGIFLSELNETYMIDLEIRDSESLVSVGMTELDDMINTFHPDSLLGDYGASRTRPQCLEANVRKIPIVNCGGTTDIYEDQEYSFGLLSPLQQLAQTTMDFITVHLNDEKLSSPFKIVLVWEDSPHGEAYRTTVEEHVANNPTLFEIVFKSKFLYPNLYESPEDFAPLMRDIYKAEGFNANGFLCDAHSSDFVLMHQALVLYDNTFEFMSYGARGADQTDKDRILQNPESTRYLVAAQWWNPSINNPRSLKYLEDWRTSEFEIWMQSIEDNSDKVESRFASASEQHTAQWYGVVAYEAARTLLDAYSRSGSLDKENLKLALKATYITDSALPGGIIEFQRPTSVGGVLNTSTINMMNNQFTLVQNMDNQPTNYSYTLYPDTEKSGEWIPFQGWTADRPTCNVDHFNHTTEECNLNNEYVATFHWLDREGQPCPTNDKCNCVDGVSIHEPVILPCEYVVTGSSEYNAIAGIAGFGVIFNSFLAIYLVINFNKPMIKYGQSHFLLIMTLSAAVLSALGMLFVGKNTSELCSLRVSASLVTTTALVGSLAVKVYRIFKLMTNKKMKRMKITNLRMLVLLLVLVAMQLLLMSLWLGTDLPSAVDSKIQVQILGISDPISVDTQVCRYAAMSAFPIICGVYLLLIIAFCNIAGYMARHTDSKYMESTSISFASYNMSILLVLAGVMLIVLDLRPARQFLLMSITLTAFGTIIVGTVIGPKALYVSGMLKAPPSTQSTVRRTTSYDESYNVGSVVTATPPMVPAASPPRGNIQAVHPRAATTVAEN